MPSVFGQEEELDLYLSSLLTLRNPLIHQKWQTKRQKCKILQEKKTALVTVCQLSCKAEKSDQRAKALGNSTGDKSLSQQFQSCHPIDQQRGLCRGGFCGRCNRWFFSTFLLKRNCCTVVEVCIHKTPAASNIICSPHQLLVRHWPGEGVLLGGAFLNDRGYPFVAEVPAEDIFTFSPWSLWPREGFCSSYPASISRHWQRTRFSIGLCFFSHLGW